ncbi:hypothetical protein GOP47_0012779 [Adiantum capillus-veneris]|uniref:Electron transfer flavoprotein subunit alpha n=1 Tax=Adiantum capillus-veneris TaxID=13818 RepID=A0A9D4URB9_ADICA|nr:hypothetical protein GOP47_0012779 [Adiantum capillus-veneris]
MHANMRNPMSFLHKSLLGYRSLNCASSRRHISTLVISEHEGGSLKGSSLNALAAASLLGEKNSVSLLVAGSSSESLESVAKQAFSSCPFISQVLVAESDKLKHPLAEAWAELILLAQQQGKYTHVMAASTSFGKNVLPRAAALLNVSPISDVVKVMDERTFVRPIYAGNALSTVKYKGNEPCLVTVRPTSFPVDTSDSVNCASSPACPVTTLDVTDLNSEIIDKSTWLGQVSQQSERPDLGSAKVVISGGRALKSKENFKMLELLADKMGGAVGATRAAVDAGYVPNDMQVGQTGKIVAPQLYVAIGVSGAIQHLAGMKDSKVIVAINKDPDAPIFQVADYGLAGDLFEIIPELLEKLPEKKQ